MNVNPQLENGGMERRSSIAGSQKDASGKWKVDMRYVSNYTEDVNIMRKERMAVEKVEYMDPRHMRLTADQLRAGTVPGVDPALKEQYLGSADFERIFGMSKEKFNAMPNWKRKNAKGKAKLN